MPETLGTAVLKLEADTSALDEVEERVDRIVLKLEKATRQLELAKRALPED